MVILNFISYFVNIEFTRLNSDLLPDLRPVLTYAFKLYHNFNSFDNICILIWCQVQKVGLDLGTVPSILPQFILREG